jgi:hypothetical protein
MTSLNLGSSTGPEDKEIPFSGFFLRASALLMAAS